MARNIAGRLRINSNVGTPTIFWNNAAPGGNGAKAQLPPPYAFAAAYSHRTPYTMEYLLNVQRQLSGNWVVAARAEVLILNHPLAAGAKIATRL